LNIIIVIIHLHFNGTFIVLAALRVEVTQTLLNIVVCHVDLMVALPGIHNIIAKIEIYLNISEIQTLYTEVHFISMGQQMSLAILFFGVLGFWGFGV
jgi:predicted naringenin-chalcone synthase